MGCENLRRRLLKFSCDNKLENLMTWETVFSACLRDAHGIMFGISLPYGFNLWLKHLSALLVPMKHVPDPDDKEYSYLFIPSTI